MCDALGAYNSALMFEPMVYMDSGTTISTPAARTKPRCDYPPAPPLLDRETQRRVNALAQKWVEAIEPCVSELLNVGVSTYIGPLPPFPDKVMRNGRAVSPRVMNYALTLRVAALLQEYWNDPQVRPSSKTDRFDINFTSSNNEGDTRHEQCSQSIATAALTCLKLYIELNYNRFRIDLEPKIPKLPDDSPKVVCSRADSRKLESKIAEAVNRVFKQELELEPYIWKIQEEPLRVDVRKMPKGSVGWCERRRLKKDQWQNVDALRTGCC